MVIRGMGIRQCSKMFEEQPNSCTFPIGAFVKYGAGRELLAQWMVTKHQLSRGICDLPQSYKPPFQVNITCHDYHLQSKKSSPPGGWFLPTSSHWPLGPKVNILASPQAGILNQCWKVAMFQTGGWASNSFGRCILISNQSGRSQVVSVAGNIRPVAEEVADIARRLQRAKHSLQDISDITGLERCGNDLIETPKLTTNVWDGCRMTRSLSLSLIHCRDLR